jgi:hypothetical protein
MERGLLTMTYYIEIGTAAQLVALHSLAHDAGDVGTGGVEVVSGWASDEPYSSMAVEIARQYLGEKIWVIVWTDTVGRGKARNALAVAESEFCDDPDAAAVRQSELFSALTEAETVARTARDIVNHWTSGLIDVARIAEPTPAAPAADRDRLQAASFDPSTTIAEQTNAYTESTADTAGTTKHIAELDPQYTFETEHIAELDPQYTFETLAVTDANRHTHAAAMVVAASPGITYNPLFVSGGTTIDKIHLLHAIGHRAISLGTATSVRYTSAEHFTHDFINSTRDGSTEAFRRRYRDVDILLINDIQFFASSDLAQEEFLLTLEALQQQTATDSPHVRPLPPAATRFR